ncbi:protein male-specific lethal-3 [Culex quinquefasciatus]|uniref:protein male-specific lethal-3 n=1 Tax=Culex quinquefasciatus TaxID=7176 RepID=UPI0018E29DE9|nr:protein male-specific lethal-3 [Culex quinquefasciatus]
MMVSTRYKYKFMDGEKVLCYEPDPNKARVLYDSKVLEVCEGKDKRGRLNGKIEYLIHFQGWNSSWDRKVGEDFILKDTEENRQLQKDLAEKSQLHQGTYLYRKERKKQREKSLTARIESLTGHGALKGPSLSEEGSSCSNGFSRDDSEFQVDGPAASIDVDTEYYSNSSSVESNHEEDKVYLQVGDKLKKFLEFDYRMISEGTLTEIPVKLPIVTILENFVRHYTIRQLFDLGQEQAKMRRRNSLFQKGDQKTKDYEAIRTNVELCKEVADGLRLYFDFTLKDYLLYPQERQQAELVLSDEYLSNFTYIASPNLSLDLLTVKLESPTADPGTDNVDPSLPGSFNAAQEEKRRRRLRSHKNEENEFMLELGFIKPETLSPGNSQALAFSLLKTAFPSGITITYQSKEILEDVFGWKILPSDAPAEPSMLYGPTHLARMIVKLPEFLSVTNIADEKLKLLLKFLDCFSDYIEEHEEWFGRHNYSDKTSASCIRIKEENLDDGMIAGPLLSDVKVEETALM